MGIMGKKLFLVDCDFWLKLQKCLERVEKCKNVLELHTAGVGLMMDTL